MNRAAGAFSTIMSLFLISPDAAAKGAGRDPERTVERLDRDSDGKVSRTEFPGPPRIFSLIDTDRDGFLTVDEFKARFAAIRSQAKPNFPVIDTHAHLRPHVERRRDAASDYPGAVAGALARMDETGVRMALLMSPPALSERAGLQSLDKLITIATSNRGRFGVLGGGSSLNAIIDGAPERGPISNALRQEFEDAAEAILENGAVGFGELTALHFSFFVQHPFEETRPDHPLFFAARRHRCPPRRSDRSAHGSGDRGHGDA